ncbi:MAG TPA: SDR family NAD(P)-dependent oxidoreductase [Candidatus Limnocylindria bacterium]|nr:SDR family NAD(P)-dependent oxidoreductase [Candidatus Limnocylindria bacterium]
MIVNSQRLSASAEQAPGAAAAGAQPPAPGTRVAIVTGGGGGLGRAYAIALARSGASVVVNDLGVSLDGRRGAGSPADAVVAEIREFGGRAVASHHDVADWGAARELIDQAFDELGDLHVLVTSAGFLRDRTLAKMSESEWTDIIRVHLTGQAGPTCHAFARWRALAEQGTAADRSVIHITSSSGLRPGVGQGNYGAAKLGAVGLSQVAALEGARYGIRANAVAPSARTRMTEPDPRLAVSGDDSRRYEPEGVADLVAWLASPTCRATGQIFHADGLRVTTLGLPPRLAVEERTQGWSGADFDTAIAPRLAAQPDIDELVGR